MPSEIERAEAPGLRVLVPATWAEDFGAFLSRVRGETDIPFSAARTAAMGYLSQQILRHPRLRRDPAGAALGFWLRPAHLAELKADFMRGDSAGRLRVPAGLVFHIAPANVDTMFVFSWALSFLAGNANIVRLTTRTSPLMEDLLQCLSEVFANAPASCRGNLFVTYGHDDAVTGQISAACDTRIIWGGDETVRRLRAISLNPHATERAFASKRSISVFDAASYTASDDIIRRKLAERMANDLAPFGQMACSSPHAVYWLGTRDVAMKARADFVERLEPAMAVKFAAPDLGWSTRRINHAFAAAAEGRALSFAHRPNTTEVRAVSAELAESDELCGAGLLTHVEGILLSELAAKLKVNHQTITYFGLTEADRTRLAETAGRAGVDRIVPVGQALDFGPQWDGYDLWTDLTRLVTVH